MDKIIKDLSLLNWDFISGAFELAFKLGLPVAIILIKPWRVFFANAISGIKFVSDMRNPKHDLYYEGIVSKVETLHNKHEEQNSERVKQLEAIIAQYEAEKKAQEKKGFESLQDSFDKVEEKVDNALEKLVSHETMFQKGEEQFRKIFSIVKKQGAILEQLRDNQNRKAA